MWSLSFRVVSFPKWNTNYLWVWFSKVFQIPSSISWILASSSGALGSLPFPIGVIPWGRQENLPKIKSLSGSVKDYLKCKVLFIPLFSFVIVLQSISIHLPYSLSFGLILVWICLSLIWFTYHPHIHHKVSCLYFGKWIYEILRLTK